MQKKELSRFKRHTRIKLRMHGTPERPRLVIRRSLKNIFAHVVDDTQKKVLFSMAGSAGNIKTAQAFGQAFAAKTKEKGISRIIFDRAGYLYHGRVKAFAEALRKGGLEF